MLSRCLRDGVETPLQRVPCAVAVVLAKASEALASSPGSEIYRVVNRCVMGSRLLSLVSFYEYSSSHFLGKCRYSFV